jgi:hypothetical protein
MRKLRFMRINVRINVQAVLCLALALPLFAQPYEKRIPPAVITAEHKALLARYDLAIYDSSVYKAEHLHPLRPLVPDANGEVLVATLTAQDGKVDDFMTIGGTGTWVTSVPEVQDKCRTFTGDVVMRLRELIGLPPDAPVPHMLVFRARIVDIFRPSTDANVTTTLPCPQLAGTGTPPECGNAFPPQTTDAHYAWIASSSFQLHQIPNGYPWTHLGYTYDWAPGADRYGASEYVIRPGAVVVVVQSTTPEEYCKP